MIFIYPAECARCGQSLKIYPGIQDGPDATGDLYLQVTSDGALQARAQCKNVISCDAWRAEHGRQA